LSAIRKVIKVEPIPRTKDVPGLDLWLRRVKCNPELARRILDFEDFLVTFECGHQQHWVDLPKFTAGSEFTCFDC
jgi:hypothetical protein